jgi:putative transposase
MDECLKLEIFYSLKEAQVVIGARRYNYDRVRPHCAPGYRSPAPMIMEAIPQRLPRPVIMQ